MSPQSLLIIGSGPGIALQSALQFASHGFTHITLTARSTTHLEETKSSILASHPAVSVSTYACDVSDTSSLDATLSSIQSEQHSPPSVILFNAAHVAPSSIGSVPASRLTDDFNTTTAALYTVATTLLPLMISSVSQSSSAPPALLITSGHIHYAPFAPFFALSASKAAQFNLSGSLAQTYGPQGIRVATLVINGIVQGEEGEMGSRNIAKEVWDLYEKGISGAKGERMGQMSVGEVGRVEDFERMVGLRK